MTNLYRPSRKHGTPLEGVFAAVILVVAIVFGFDSVTGGIVREYARGAGGAARSIAVAAAASVVESGFFSSRASLARENETLRREIALSAERGALTEFLRKENTALQEMARLARQEQGLTVRVLSSLESSPYGTFLIDAGTHDGVSEGAVVLTEGGFVLGTVTSASAGSATVQSLFAPGVQNDFLVDETAFMAEGRGGGNARADVPRGSPLTIGDTAVAARFGRPAGNVLHIESASSSATARLLIRIPVNLDTLRFVYVIPR